jgi:hypothetical protein
MQETRSNAGRPAAQATSLNTVGNSYHYQGVGSSSKHNSNNKVDLSRHVPTSERASLGQPGRSSSKQAFFQMQASNGKSMTQTRRNAEKFIDPFRYSNNAAGNGQHELSNVQHNTFDIGASDKRERKPPHHAQNNSIVELSQSRSPFQEMIMH